MTKSEAGAGEEHGDAGHVVGHAPAPGRRARQRPARAARRPARARARVSAVSIQPGRMAFTWMLSLRPGAWPATWSAARCRPCWRRRAAANAAPKIDIIEPMLMILPPPRCFSCRIGGLAAEEGAGQVAVEHLVPLRERVLLRRLADVDAGVVDQDVEPAVAAHRLADQARQAASSSTSTAMAAAWRARGLRSLRPPRSFFVLVAAGDRRPRARRRPAPCAMPRPMPPLPPVTIATRPLRSNRLMLMPAHAKG